MPKRKIHTGGRWNRFLFLGGCFLFLGLCSFFLPTDTRVVLLPGVLFYVPVRNTGISFSLLASLSPAYLALGQALLSGVVLWIGWRIRKNSLATAILMVAAGGIYNVIDRLLHGAVLDYFALRIFMPLFVFNVADSFITVGVLWVLWLFLRRRM